MKYVAPIFVMVLICFLLWCAGFDFDTRGPKTFMVALTCIIAGYFTFELPKWK